MPRAFAFPFGVATPLVWTPIVIGDDDAIRKRNKTLNYQVIARLDSGVTLQKRRLNPPCDSVVYKAVRAQCNIEPAPRSWSCKLPCH